MRVGRTAAWAVLVLVSAPVIGCERAPAPGAPVVSVSRNHCGEGWTRPHSGQQVLRVRNTGSLAATARLVDPSSGVIYAEVDQLGPGAERDMPVVLGRGEYAVRCLVEAHAPATGPAVRISDGPAAAAPAALPVTVNDLLGPLRQYQDHVAAGLEVLQRDVVELRDAVRSGSVESARRRWLTAHLDYERLGAAYGAFGERGDRINGLPHGLPGGVGDPEFTGFHRLELGLWRAEPRAGLAPVADGLVDDVASLRADFRQQRIDPLDLGLRGHEILEDALRFELTGESDMGSGSGLATARANLDGTRAVLDVLRPLLTTRYPGLSDMDRSLERLGRELDAHRRPDGTWQSLADLSTRDRQRIDGAIGEALERLAPVAALCEPRRQP